MGESSAWRWRSFSQPSSPTSSAEKQGNPLNRALTSSVSFGRFMTEQLDWEKWSAFNRNRYLEDAEKYSRPGSVAERKAFFEAHYRSRRNAALVEKQNAVTSDFSESSIANDLIEETKGDVVHNRELVSSIAAKGCIATVDERKLEDASTGGAENVREPPLLTENLVEFSIELENDGHVGNSMPDEDIEEDKVVATNGDSASSDKKKPAFSSSKLSTNVSASNLVLPAKQETPVQLRKNDSTTVNSSTERNSISKKNLTATSLHVSVDFASCAGETKKVSSAGLEKTVNSRLVRTLAKTSKESTHQQNPTKASVDVILKRPSVSPQPEKRRIITKHDKSLSGNRTVTRKMQHPNLSYYKSSSIWKGEARCSTVSSSLTFKSEERVAKIKEFFQKLEPKLNTKEAGKKQPHKKLQVKAADDNKDLCHSTSSNATPNAKVFHKTESPNKLKKKIPTLVKPHSPKFQGKEAPKVHSIDSRPPWRLSTKMGDSKNVTGKNSLPQVNASKLFARKSMHENKSPNIQQ